MGSNKTWARFTLPIAYTGEHYYGTASSAFDGHNVCFGGEDASFAIFSLSTYGVMPGAVPPYSDTIAINWHCIGW